MIVNFFFIYYIKSSLGQMTNNIKNIDLIYFQGLIKRTAFYLKSKEDVDSGYNLEILIIN